MNLKILLFAPFLLLMSSCKTQTSQAESSVSNDNTLHLILEKQVKIPNSKISVKFKEIVEDSRCPIDVTCVWEGIAVVNLEITSGNQKQEMQISNQNMLERNLSRTINISGYKISWLQLKPQPGENEQSPALTLQYDKE